MCSCGCELARALALTQSDVQAACASPDANVPVRGSVDPGAVDGPRWFAALIERLVSGWRANR